MKVGTRLKFYTVALLALILFTGCGDDDNAVEPSVNSQQMPMIPYSGIAQCDTYFNEIAACMRVADSQQDHQKIAQALEAIGHKMMVEDDKDLLIQTCERALLQMDDDKKRIGCISQV